MFREVAEGPGAAGQGPLLDDRPVVGVHVRGGLVPKEAARVPAQMSSAEAPVRKWGLPVRERCGGAGDVAVGGVRGGSGGVERRGRRRRLGARVRGVRVLAPEHLAAALLRRGVLRVRRHGGARVAALVRQRRARLPPAALLLAAAPPRPARPHTQLPVRQRPWYGANVREHARSPRADVVGRVFHQRPERVQPVVPVAGAAPGPQGVLVPAAHAAPGAGLARGLRPAAPRLLRSCTPLLPLISYKLI